MRKRKDFNSRPSARGDTGIFPSPVAYFYFNSRPSARGDAAEWLPTYKSEVFQFTPLREGRRCAEAGISRKADFNSRPSARGDADVPRLERTAMTNFNSRPSARGDGSPRRARRRTKNFNSRPSARGDLLPAIGEGSGRKFQFTPLREGRPFPLWKMRSTEAFQFTPLREGRPNAPPSLSQMTCYFNSRPSARGDTSASRRDESESQFQFTPLREGRRMDDPIGIWGKEISIHAPPRGATLRNQRLTVPPRISIHAPPRGATILCGVSPSAQCHFNSRPSARGDVEKVPICRAAEISIHAPPRGATPIPRP